MNALLLLPLGLVGGVVTTVAGMGGGLLLVLLLSLIVGPAQALAVTTPALLASNLHRMWMYRGQVSVVHLARFALGAVPGALLGAFFTVSVPPRTVQGLLLLVTAYAVVQAVRRWRRAGTSSAARITPPPRVGRWFITLSGAAGLVTGAAGGAGFVVAPLLLSAGLAGETYVATVAGCAVALHAARVVGYGASGLLGGALAGHAVVLALSLALGNRVGATLRRFTGRLPDQALEYGALAVCAALALAGLGA